MSVQRIEYKKQNKNISHGVGSNWTADELAADELAAASTVSQTAISYRYLPLPNQTATHI